MQTKWSDQPKVRTWFKGVICFMNSQLGNRFAMRESHLFIMNAIFHTGLFTALFVCFHSGVAMAAPEKRVIDGVEYHILRAPAAAVRILWKDADGKPLRTLPKAAEHLAAKGERVLAVMNGGIFEPGFIPSGLLVQDGVELNPINRNDGQGNFFLKPNGVFFTGPKGAAVVASTEYPVKNMEVSQAVQSGPLLLRRGVIHPAFNATSESRLTRNGVGVAKSGEVVFAMTDFHSEKLPNLHEFARLLITLGCDDALFLDGDLSQMRSGEDLAKPSNNFGSIIAVLKPAG